MREADNNNNLCDFCKKYECIFQSKIIRNRCDFYEEKETSWNLDKVYEELEVLRNKVIKMDLKYSETTEILSLILKIERECDKAEREKKE